MTSILFLNSATVSFRTSAKKHLKEAIEIQGPWEINFQEERGAPESSVTFTNLVSWTERHENGIKFFSGTASYKNNFKLTDIEKEVHLDLGEVKKYSRNPNQQQSGRNCMEIPLYIEY